MKKIFTVLSALFVAVAAMAQADENLLWPPKVQDVQAQEDPLQKFNPKQEFRGAWIHIVGNSVMRKMSTKAIQDWFVRTVDSLQYAGCNAVIFQVRPQADAFFQSELEPWTRYLTGTQGKAPNPYWDPLQFMIDECHKRGMELHAWLNPYRVTSTEKDELAPNHLYHKRPDLFVKYGKQWYFDPAEPDARKHTVNVIADIVNRYDVDAIHFDDYFYPYPIAGEEFPDANSFKKYGIPAGYTAETKADWRRNNVEVLIKEINDTIKSIKPWIRFGISPFGIHRNKAQDPKGSNTNGLSNYDQLFADVPGWAQKGYIDYIVPQIYWIIGHKRADYETLVNWWNDSNFGGQLYIGQNIATFEEPDLRDSTTTQMARKMEMVRELPHVDGNVWWPGWTIPKNDRHIADSLSQKYQHYPALIPPYKALDSKAPAAVALIKVKDGKMTWKCDETKDVFQQPSWYVIYRYPSGERPDYTQSRYILKVTRDTEYEFSPEDKGCLFQVSVIDRCWNESAPSVPVSSN